MLIKLNSIVIVEGKYDKINLKNYIDAVIFTTDGFQIYKDKQKQMLIKELCKINGAVIITDSDAAGAQIRAFLKSLCADGKIINVYLPQIKGKEKRKSVPSKQGFLGAEGLSGDIILDALNRCGVTGINQREESVITKADMYEVGLSGHTNSREARERFCRFAGLPSGLSPNALLDAINVLYSREKFLAEAKRWRQEQVKN